MNKDTKEKSRKLSPAEQRRLARYEETSKGYTSQGFRRSELTVGIVFANMFALLYGLPFAAISFFLFYYLHPDNPHFVTEPSNWIILFVIILILTVVHELIHGITWSIFAEHHWKDIEFGFMVEYLTPYCACACPLQKGQYIIGALMPLIILGLIPTIAGILAGSALWTLVGIIMTMSAGGDILVVINILRYKTRAKEMFYMDHPTQAGGVIFER